MERVSILEFGQRCQNCRGEHLRGERFRTHRRSDHQKPKAQLEIGYLMTKRRQDGRRTLATRNSGEHHNGNHKHQQHSHGDAHPERKARLHHGRTTGSGRAIANLLGSVGAEIFTCRRHQAELIDLPWKAYVRPVRWPPGKWRTFPSPTMSSEYSSRQTKASTDSTFSSQRRVSGRRC